MFNVQLICPYNNWFLITRALVWYRAMGARILLVVHQFDSLTEVEARSDGFK